MLLFSLSFSTHTTPPCGLASSTGINRRQINLRFCTNQFDISIFPFENAVLLFLSQDLVNVWSKYLVKIFETYCVHSSLVDNGLFFKIKRRSGRACCLLSIQWTTSWGEGYIKLKYQKCEEKKSTFFCISSQLDPCKSPSQLPQAHGDVGNEVKYPLVNSSLCSAIFFCCLY